jgi:hypothetical protein
VQIVGYETAVDPSAEAVLVFARNGTAERCRLSPGATLEYRLEDRHCAGELTEDGHNACDVPEAPFCDRHVSRWPCARCTGDCTRPIDACREEHAVYLAAFAPDAFKVGVTRSWRLETRLREQGADRAAHLRTVADGRIAREIEGDLAVDVGDSVRVATKLAGLHRRVDETAWADCLADFEVIETFDFDYGLELSDRPMAETMAAGTVVGTKGRALVLERAASTYAVDMRDLVGYDVAESSPNRRLQSNLGAFE